MKKLSTFLLTALMLMGTANIYASSYTDSNGLVYDISGTQAIITGYTGSGGAITIPEHPGGSSYANCDVVEIQANAFANKTTITSVTINDPRLRNIGQNAFSGCSNLQSLTMDDCYYAMFIRESAFANCPKLQTVTFNHGIGYIKASVFAYCSSLYSLTIDDVYEIDPSAFTGCTGMKTITYKNGVKVKTPSAYPTSDVSTTPFYQVRRYVENLFVNTQEVQDYLFQQMTNLSKVEIGSMVEKIGKYAFDGCSKLTTFSHSEAAKLESIDDCAFRNCPITNSLTFKANETPRFRSVGANTFYGYKGTHVYLNCSWPGESLTIGDNAFANASELSYVDISGDVSSISASAFSNCPNITGVNMNLTNNWYQAYTSTGAPFAYKSNLNLVRMSGPFIVPDYFFAGSGVKEAIIEANGGIWPNTFYNCQSLSAVTWDAVLPMTFNTTPFGLSPITSLTIGERVTNLPEHLFSGCSSLNTIESKAVNPPTIDQSTFSGCNYGNLSGINLTVPAGSENLYRRAKVWCEFYDVCDGTEDIEEVQGDDDQSSNKVLLDGVIYIQRDGKLYNLQGAQVQ